MHEPIHITVHGRSDDPRLLVPPPPGVIIHHSQPLHPDDLDVVDGIRCTSLARTLVDCAEEMDRDELVELFRRARESGRLDMAAVRASRSRVEWRPSLAMLDDVIAEFG
jgi:hypothetical protein